MESPGAERGPAPMPTEPTITIISSDGEAFSLSPSAIAHSHLLEGAVRRWAEVYQAALKGRPGASALGPQSSLADADDDDATADDLEETPDENYIARFYDETASDVTAASAALDDGNGAGSATSGAAAAAARGGAGDGDDEVRHVTRMMSVPAAGEETGPLHEALDGESGTSGSGGKAHEAAEGSRGRLSSGDGNDSDRTASVLPSSAEGSLSSVTSPFKSQSNGGTPTRAGEAGRVVELAAAPQFIPAFAPPPQPQQPASAAPLSPSASAGRIASAGASRSSSAAAAAALGEGGSASGRAQRSPAAALVSPASRGSHPSPSTLMDADQSTPSVLSDEEAEENVDDEDGAGAGDGAAAKPGVPPRDPRNLGDEGLDDGEGEGVSGTGPRPASSPEPEPATATAATSAAYRAAPLMNGRAAAARHADPTAHGSTAAAAAGSADAAGPLPSPSSPNSAGAAQRPPTPSSSASERRRSSTVVQAAPDADADGDDDGFSSLNGFAAGEGIHAAGAPALSIVASAEAPLGAAGRHSTSPVPPDWRSPSSCHQRTPCMGDEDDVGALLSDDAVSPPRTDDTGRPSNSTVGGGSSPASRPPAPGPTAPPDRTSPTIATDPVSGAAVAEQAADGSGGGAAGAPASDADDPEELRSSVVYADGIRITSSAIVFDLLRPLTPASACASPHSPPDDGATARRTGGGSMTSAEATPLASPSADETSASALRSAASGVMTASPSSVPASTTATAPLHIASATLVLCIKYMTHFAEAEAQAAAAAAAAAARGRRHKHRRHHARRQNSDSAATATSDEDAEGGSRAAGRSSTSGTTSRSSSTSAGTTSDASDSGDEGGSTVSDASFNPTVVGVPGGAAGPAQTTANTTHTSAAAGAGAGTVGAGGPAIIAAPLSAPLVAVLSPWERSFLYADLLGAPEAVLTASLAILEVCPGFDYGSPSIFLGDAKVKAALMAPPPPPEGVHALMEVMAAAKQLQIEPLHALCAGWLADFMIRVSYGATDNFEAAHLIRQCLRVPSDWSRRETDCLKMENEWPANEDAE